ncbi:uncharacterized protein LOC120635647 isoform X2 [Pararge aegeria]|uniref:uncharacterized protein LOC120635647 isoform X2 n=1 Tax=Pararge aegeria TaxID=116150 RepID=UPI0019D01E8D|nr:uncharacterized protein LOC120635647 isoform X2 [Pararge aegeria]
MAYKWCAVPKCTNTSIKTPEKLFVSVPRKADLRRKWLRIARRDPNEIRAASTIFFCEDHFDMQKDIRNFMQYKMGLSVKLLIVDGVLPSKFACQLEQKRLCYRSTSQDATIRRKRLKFKQECVEETPSILSSTSVTINHIVGNGLQETVMRKYIKPSKHNDMGVNTEAITTAEKSVQINWMHCRSQDAQTKTAAKDVSISPLKFSTSAKYTSPFKTTQSCDKPSRSVFKMPLNNAEKCKNYRKRKKEATLKIKKATLTSAERSRMYRLRKKQLAQGIQSSVNEVMYTPSTSNLRMTFEPLPQPVTTKELLHQAHKQSVNTDCLIVPKKEISEELSDNILHVNTEAPLEFNVQLVKPIKTELILSENMVQLREQGSTRDEAIQNPHLSIQHNLPKMRLKPDVGASVAGYCAQTPEMQVSKVLKQNMEDLSTQTHSEYLIVPKKEIIEDLEVTFQNEYNYNIDIIVPKQELSDDSGHLDDEDQLDNNMDLLKPVDRDMVEVRHQDSTHAQTTQNQYVSYNATQIKSGVQDVVLQT